MDFDRLYRWLFPARPVLGVAPDGSVPPLVVQGYTGAAGSPGTPEHQAWGVHRTLFGSLGRCQRVLTEPLTGWPTGGTLTANPRAGRMLNAFYDRYFLNFFWDADPVTKTDLYLADLPDVVAHELGHAILDAVRPDLWAVQSVEIQSFHEAFGDINAILHALGDEAAVAGMLAETAGDLRRSNRVSRLAEEMQVVILHNRGETPTPDAALRDAVNSLSYQQPEGLPTKVPGQGLAGEPHSFSRVFLGGWWTTLVLLYERERAGREPAEAVRVAKDLLARVTFNGVRTAPVTPRFFGSVLTAMIKWDELAGTGCHAALLDGFAQHGVLPLDITPMPPPKTGALFMNFHASETVRVGDWSPGADPLLGVICELPNPRVPLVYAAANPKDLLDSIAAARHSLTVIRDHGRVGAEKDAAHEFSVIDGRLVRNHYQCWFSPPGGCRSGRRERRRWVR